MALTFADVVREGYGYSSILRAIERLILLRSPVLPNRYEANFEGITRALWDLGTVLEGDIPAPATSSTGPLPPNWDASAGDYRPGGEPSDGSFWFDERQGRLFIAKDGEWMQANGAECFMYLGDHPPARETPGVLWFDTRQGTGFVYVDDVTGSGEPGWYPLGGDGASGIQFRRDTAANWQSTNPTLAEGEPGYEIDTDRMKIGDGATAWNDLPYHGTTFGIAAGLSIALG